VAGAINGDDIAVVAILTPAAGGHPIFTERRAA